MILAQATQPAADHFTVQDVAALIGAITALLVALPAAIYAVMAFTKAAKAEVSAAVAQGSADAAKAVGEVNAQRITNTSAHVTRVDGDQTALAAKVGEVAGAATATATALLAAQQQQTQQKL